MLFASLVAAAAAALPLFVSATIPSNCARTYKVVEGDTCDAISAANNASTYQLAVVNSEDIDAACSNLAIDQVICLGTIGEDCTNTYIVQPDNTCDAITTNIGVNTTMLYANNPQIDAACDNIYIGEVLCAASVVTVPPPPANRPIAVAPVVAPVDHDDDIPECDDANDDGEW